MPTEIKTDPRLLAKLKDTASRPLSPEQRHRRRVSFIYGALPTDSSITIQQIEAVLAKADAA